MALLVGPFVGKTALLPQRARLRAVLAMAIGFACTPTVRPPPPARPPSTPQPVPVLLPAVSPHPQADLLRATDDLYRADNPATSLIDLRTFRQLLEGTGQPLDVALVDTRIARALAALGQRQAARDLLASLQRGAVTPASPAPRATANDMAAPSAPSPALTGEGGALVEVLIGIELGELDLQEQNLGGADAWLTVAFGVAQRARLDTLAAQIATTGSTRAGAAGRSNWAKRGVSWIGRSPDGEARLQLGVYHLVLGQEALYRGEWEQASALLSQAHALSPAPEQRTTRWAAAHGLGFALQRLGRPREALTWLEPAAREQESAAWADGTMYEQIGECLLTLGYPRRAHPYFVAAYQLLRTDSGLATREPARLERLRALAQ